MKFLILVVVTLAVLHKYSLQSQTFEVGEEKCYCWTRWLDRDNPSGFGDYETLADFHHSLVCPNPQSIQCRVKSTRADWQTTGQVYICNNQVGGTCTNSENSSPCLDYEVRFLCDCPEPTTTEPITTEPTSSEPTTAEPTTVNSCRWTRWLDRDNPSGFGDYETLADFHPSLVCPNPQSIQCRVKSTRADWQTTGQVYICNNQVGGTCTNSENSSPCLDYEVRFLCDCPEPTTTEPITTEPTSSEPTTAEPTTVNSCRWTRWLDRDNPSGFGDYETLADFHPSLVCPNPQSIQCRVKSTRADWQTTGQVYICNNQVGGTCTNSENSSPCLDYEVRFLCDCPEPTTTEPITTEPTSTEPTGTGLHMQ